LCASVLCSAILIARLPPTIGELEDDGIYLVTAKALAEGRGYRHLHLPGEPYQTKYPVLYPFLLSWIWRAISDFPVRIAAMQVLNAVCGAGAAWLGYRLLRRTWKLPAWLAGASALLAVSNPMWLTMVGLTMSELPFALFSLAALSLAASSAHGDPASVTRNRGAARALAIGTLASAAYLTRSMGVTVVAAVLVHGALEERWRDTLVTAATAAVLCGAWWAWSSWAKQANAAIPAAAALGYDLDYGVQMRASASALGRVLLHNVVTSAYSVFHLIVLPSDAWLGEQLLGGWLLYAGVAIVAGLFLFGLWTAPRGGRSLTHTYLLSSFALIWLWPFDAERLLIPLLPLLLAGVLAGLWRTCQLLRRPWAARLIVLLGVGALLGHYGLMTWGFLSSPVHDFRSNERQLMSELIQRHTPERAVIASVNGAYYHLATGRRFVSFVPTLNQIAAHYPTQRKLWEFGLTLTNEQKRSYQAMLAERLLDYYRAAGVTHVLVMSETGGEGLAFRRFRESVPQHFELVREVWTYRLYAFRT
jgi:hypothetical protein